MNERIRELAEQNGFVHKWQPPGEQHDILKNLERFADLIIQECANVVDQHEPLNTWTQRYSQIIKNHFNV